jgi:hypothetical protein
MQRNFSSFSVEIKRSGVCYALGGLKLWAFRFKSKILLGEITKRYDDARGDYFGNGRIQMKMFDKKADKNIIQDDTNNNQQEITEQLNPPMKYRTRKHNVAHEHKTCRETDQKRYNESGYMGLKSNKSKMQNLFVQNIVICQEKNEDIKGGICASAGSIPESLKGNKLSEGRIEKIYERNDLFFWHKSSDSAREVNINGADSLPNKYYFCAQFNTNGAYSGHQICRSENFNRKLQSPD